MARRIDRLQAANFHARGVQTWSQRVGEQIEQSFTDLEGVIADLTAAVADIAAAQAAANAAQSTADTVKRNDAIADSYTVPGSILTGEDAGSDARIVIANHTRKYNDNTSVSITGTTLTGLAYSTKHYVYYDDTTRAVTAPTFQATTDAKTALPGTAAGRHYCGTVTTPAGGGGSTTGGYTPPGGGGGVTPDNVF